MKYIPEGNASILRQILGWLYSLEDIIDPSRLVKVNVRQSSFFPDRCLRYEIGCFRESGREDIRCLSNGKYGLQT